MVFADDGPHAGRGVCHATHLRHDPRPYARDDLPPRGGLRRVGDPPALSAAELEYGHGLPAHRARRTHLPAGRTGPPHHRTDGRQGQLRHRGGLPRGAGRARRQSRAATYRARLLRPGGGRRPCGPGGRLRCGDDARPRFAGCGRQGPAAAAGAAERPVGHDDRDGGPHGRDPGDGESRAQCRRDLRRTRELRPGAQYGTGFDLQAGDDAHAAGRRQNAALDGLRHPRRRPGDGGPGQEHPRFAPRRPRDRLPARRGFVVERLLRQGDLGPLRDHGQEAGVQRFSP